VLHRLLLVVLHRLLLVVLHRLLLVVLHRLLLVVLHRLLLVVLRHLGVIPPILILRAARLSKGPSVGMVAVRRNCKIHHILLLLSIP
jgi:hypothetical protein